MTQLQFWLLTILTMFFVTIGITCLAVMLGFFKNADERFKRWAIPGFLAGVVSAWFSLFRLAAILQGRKYEGFSLVKHVFAHQNHCEVAAPGFQAGLKFALKR